MLFRKLSEHKAAAARSSGPAAEQQLALEAFVAAEQLAGTHFEQPVEKNPGWQLESRAKDAGASQVVAHVKNPRQHRSDNADLS